MIDVIKNADFNKSPIIPAIIQDRETGTVLMLGYMNKEALQKSISTRRVTFFSRSKNRLWTKGETSGNYLMLEDIRLDCDRDTLLLQASTTGPVCHTGSDTCFGTPNQKEFIPELEELLKGRRDEPFKDSYTSGLFKEGVEKISKKVGEESTELIIEAMKTKNRSRFLEESADLLFHFLMLLIAREYSFFEVIEVLKRRRKSRS